MVFSIPKSIVISNLRRPVGLLLLALGTLSASIAARAPQVGGARPSEPFGRGGSEIHYRIEARLDGETKQLTGREEIRWTNRSGEAANDLWFHLYLNAFSNNRSTHLTEAEGKLKGKKIETGWGWSRVQSIALVDEEGRVLHDLFPTFQYRQPDDGNEDDRTVFSVDLPQPVADGETIRIQVTWECQLPRVRRRTGYKDDFLLVAQWFPKLGVLESGRGWNAHQFHMNSEFYSDYGTYEVTLDLPERYRGKVFGSGVKANSVLKGDRVEESFVAPSRIDQRRPDMWGKLPVVHDFTWTADPAYTEKSYRFSFEDWASRFPDEVAAAERAFGPDEKLELRDVLITVLIHPERADQAERHRKATEAALFFYGLWFGEYPYEHVTVVDPAWGARAAGGMEYPTIFTCGTALHTTEDMHRPESVTVHEAGHQFWFGLVGNNEFEAAWMDEGFNSFTDSEVMARVYGPRRSTTQYAGLFAHGVPRISKLGSGKLHRVLTGREIPLPFVENLTPLPEFGGDDDPNAMGFVDWWRDQPQLTFSPEYTDTRWADRSSYLRNPATDVMDTPAWGYVDRSSYSTNSYPRPAVALRSLRGLVGDEPFMRGMRSYAKEWRYGHPYPEDFFASFQAGAGLDEDISWYFEELFQGTGTVDWSVSVDQKRRASPAGFFQSGQGEFLEVEMPEDERGDDDGDSDEEDDRAWVIDIVLRREGQLRLPLAVRMTFEDGEVREFTWNRSQQGDKPWLRHEFESSRKLVSVVLDPDNAYWIDTDLSNNRWYDEKDEVAPLRWGERVFSRMTHMLHWYAGLGG